MASNANEPISNLWLKVVKPISGLLRKDRNAEKQRGATAWRQTPLHSAPSSDAQKHRTSVAPNHIPDLVSRQLRKKFNVNFNRYSRMKPRKMSFEGVDCRVLLKLHPVSSSAVMSAEFLIANETFNRNTSSFNKKPLAFENGSCIAYQFYNWTQVEKFLERLPVRIPSNKVTIPVTASGHPMSIYDFIEHIDFGGTKYQCSYQPVRGMKKLKDELRSFGFSA